MNILKWFLALLVDSRGEEGLNEEAAGQEGIAAEAGNEDLSEQNLGSQEKVGQDEVSEPKYGEFGNEPSVDDIWSAHQELLNKHNQLNGQARATEQNLSTLRSSLSTGGYQLVTDANGNVVQIMKQQQQETKPKFEKKFTDSHAQMFEPTVLEAMQLMVQDYLAEFGAQRDERKTRMTQEQQQFESVASSSSSRMNKMFPSLNKTDQGFNQAFYDRVTAHYNDKTKDYYVSPRAKLLAAIDAAEEFGIQPMAIAQAKAEGYNAGKEKRTVLGSVQSTTSKKQSSGSAKLSNLQYLALDADARRDYDLKQISARGVPIT